MSDFAATPTGGIEIGHPADVGARPDQLEAHDNPPVAPSGHRSPAVTGGHAEPDGAEAVEAMEGVG